MTVLLPILADWTNGASPQNTGQPKAAKGRMRDVDRFKLINDTYDHLAGDDLPLDQHPIYLALHRGLAQRDRVLGILAPETQQPRWLIINATPHYRADETTLSQVYAVFTDITERKQAEDKLRRGAQATAVTEERQRLARDLHDSVTQLLGMMKK